MPRRRKTYMERPLRPESARAVTTTAIALGATLCLVHGVVYVLFRPPYPSLPIALRALLDLPAIQELGRLGGLIPGVLWLTPALAGFVALLTRLLVFKRASNNFERIWWWSVIIVFGAWGGMFVGGALTVAPTATVVFGAMYLIVGGLIAVLWWACVVARRQAEQLSHRQELLAQHGLV